MELVGGGINQVRIMLKRLAPSGLMPLALLTRPPRLFFMSMSERNLKNGHYSPKESRINFSTLDPAGSSQLSQLAKGRFFDHLRAQTITSNHHILDVMASNQSETATPRSQNTFLNSRDPGTPHPGPTWRSKNKLLSMTKVSPGGSVYQKVSLFHFN